MTSLRFRKRRAPNVVRGGRAIPLDNNGELYYLQGRSHAQGGIDIGRNPRTGIEAEGGEIVQMKPNELRVLSAQDFIGGGVSPAKQVLAGADPDKVFNEQERFKDRHRLNDDGTKYEDGGNITARDVAGFIPYVGDALDIYDIGKDIKDKKYINAAIGLGLLAVPNIIEKPIKLFGKKAIRKIANGIADYISRKPRTDKIVNEFYNTDVIPRLQLYQGIEPNIQSTDLEYVVDPRKVGGNSGIFYHDENQAYIPYPFNDNEIRETKVHELAHKIQFNRNNRLYKERKNNKTVLPNGDMSYEITTDPDIQTTSEFADEMLERAYPVKNKVNRIKDASNQNVEREATNRELRFRYWNKLRNELKRTPTIEEIDNYINNKSFDEIKDDLFHINKYGEDYVNYLNNDNRIFFNGSAEKNVKDALIKVGVMSPFIINSNKENNQKQNGGMIATINGNVKNGLITTPRFKSGGSIHIDPSKRGTFTAAAKAHGKSVQGFASQVLANKDNYSPAMVKKANFARNASKWNHKTYGGRIKADDGNKTKSNKDNTKSTRGLRNPELTESWANTIGGASSIQRQIANPTDWMDINEQQDRWSALYANSGYIPGDEFSRRTPGTSAYQKDFNARYNDANQNMDLAVGRRGNSGDSFNSYTDNDEQGYFGPMTYRRNLGVARNAQERIDITNYYNQLNPDLGVFFREDGSVRVMPKLSTPELKVPEAVRPDLGPISNTIVPQAHARAVQQDALHRAPFAKNYRDEIGLGLGLAGSILDPILRGRQLRNLRSWNPYLEAPVKLKTNWNINPQLDRIRESSQEAYRDIDANTASSSNALARKQRVRNQAQYAANEQWATKENKETELINQDKINRQGVRNRNANRLNQWAADDARIRNRITLAKADNISNAIQNVVGVGLDYLGRKDFKDYVNNTKAAIAAGAPNVDDRYMIAQGLGFENPYNTGIPTYANTPYRRSSRFGSRTRLNRR